MIGWMQKNRKYLVVTIWISTIAFVGAGFVGWGAYSFGSSGSSVAKVGEVEVPMSDLQKEYSRIFELYNQMFGGKLDKEQAKQLGIEDQALNNLLTQALFLNYAKEVGLRVGDEEVAKEVSQIESFYEDGRFSQDIYKRVLAQNNLKPSDFEESIRKSILIEKIRDIIKPRLTDLEKEAINAAFYMQNRLRVEVLDIDDFSPAIIESELKEFWEKNKENYPTAKEYEIEAILVKNSDTEVSHDEVVKYYEENRFSYRDRDDKILSFEDAKIRVENDILSSISQREALERYISLKKGEIEGTTLLLDENNLSLGEEILTVLNRTEIGESIKPVAVPNGYITFKLKSIKDREPMDFTSARELARADYIKSIKSLMLEERAKSSYKNFEGEFIGYVSRDDITKFPKLTEEQSAQFLKELFASKDSRGYVILGEKAVLYNILEQKLLLDAKSDNSQFVEQNALTLKESSIEQAFIEDLQKRYEVTTYR